MPHPPTRTPGALLIAGSRGTDGDGGRRRGRDPGARGRPRRADAGAGADPDGEPARRELPRDLRTDRRPAGAATASPCTFVRAEGTPGDSDRYPRWNLVARREGARPGPCVHFNGHIDVVEAGQGWTVDPFGGELVDGRIYGRGTCDMKGGLAAAIVAVEAFLALVPGLPGRDRDLRHRRRGVRRLRRRRHLARLGAFLDRGSTTSSSRSR